MALLPVADALERLLFRGKAGATTDREGPAS